MLSQCRRALDLSAGQRPKTFVNRTGARIARRSYSNEQKKRALIMDANGIIYKRNEKKIAALTRYLAETGRYDMFNLDLESLTSAAEKLEHMRIEANTGVVTSHHYYMTLLLSLPLQPVDISGAISAITDAEYNITLFPDIHEALRMLKDNHGVKLGIVTDSMTPTPEKRNWIEKAGLNTEIFDVIVNSSEIGACKPDPRMYNTAMEKMGVTPEETAFLGHRGSELNGAKSLGLTTLVMFPDADLLFNNGKALTRYDYYLPGWKHVPELPFWPPASKSSL